MQLILRHDQGRQVSKAIMNGTCFWLAETLAGLDRGACPDAVRRRLAGMAAGRVALLHRLKRSFSETRLPLKEFLDRDEDVAAAVLGYILNSFFSRPDGNAFAASVALLITLEGAEEEFLLFARNIGEDGRPEALRQALVLYATFAERMPTAAPTVGRAEGRPPERESGRSFAAVRATESTCRG